MGERGDTPAEATAPDVDHDAERLPRIDYGIDAWSTVVRLAFGAFGAGLVMLLAAIAHAPGWLSLGAFGACAVLAIGALVLVWSSRVGKLRERVRLVDWLELVPDACVLDAGCGSGVMLVELARRTPEGLAVGVDVWESASHGPRGPEVVSSNARLEGVAEQTVVTTATVGSLPFADASFDAVCASLLLGRLDGGAARVEAVREVTRVLAPGGRLVALDTARTRQIVVAMRSADLADVARSRRVWRLLPPARYVTGRKPSA